MLILYTDKGYLDVSALRSSGYKFIFCTGAKGIGKTYGELLRAYKQRKQGKTLLVRYNQVQVDAICNVAGNPYIQINKDIGCDVQTKKVDKYIGAAYADGERFMDIMALSTFHNISSFGGADYEWIFYDEFIPDINARRIKDEANALYVLMENINRSRELNGKQFCQLFAASNSNTLNNRIYMDWGLLPLLQKMMKTGEETMADEKRSCILLHPAAVPISEQKSKTALYRMLAGTRFYDFGINNRFTADDVEDCISKPLREYKYITSIEHASIKIAIYRHKSTGFYYIRQHGAKKCVYNDNTMELTRFRACYPELWDAILLYRVEYEDIISQVSFKDIWRK